MHNFRQKIIPNSSINLEIEILSIIENIELNKFLKTYKISNLWNGKFFIKRIIKKFLNINCIVILNGIIISGI